MLILPIDALDLFCVSMNSTSDEWVARFLGGSPLIYCRLGCNDFLKKLNGSLKDKVVYLAVFHEKTHYGHVMALVPLQLYYWAWLSSFMELHKIMARTEAEELRIDAENARSICIPPSPLSHGMSVHLGKVELDYKILLEGLAIKSDLNNPELSLELRDAFASVAFGNASARRKNFTYIRGFELVSKVMQKIKNEGLDAPFERIVRFVNLFPLFDSDFITMIQGFFLTDSLPGELRENICAASLKGGLVNVGQLLYDTRLVREIETYEKHADKFFQRMLEIKAVKIRKVADSCLGDSYIATTAAGIAVLLCYSFDYIIHANQDRKKMESALDLAEVGFFSPPIVFGDGIQINRLLERKGLPDPSVLWIGFAIVKELTRWIVEGGKLVCPFYRFFGQNLGTEGVQVLTKFCSYLLNNSGNITSFAPCKSYCTLKRSVLNLSRLSQGEKDLCFFWRSVLKSFKKFKKVRRCD